jgi:tetratricopeptide (TPR) repeat protein
LLDASKTSSSKASSEFIFWLGAGASVSAGIPSSEGIVDRFLERRWLQFETPDEFDKPPVPSWGRIGPVDPERREKVRSWALQNVPEIGAWLAKNPGISLKTTSDNWWMLYSACMDSLKGRVPRQEFIYEVMRGVSSPNKAHILLAHLMRKGFASTVLTTNFDDLLMRAFGLFNERVAELNADSTEELTINAMFLQIAYLHGKLMSYCQRHTDAELKQTVPGFESFLREALKKSGLIVIGYRGGRETPMDVLVNVLEGSASGPGRPLFWVSYEKDLASLSERVQRILSFEGTYWVPGWSADELMETLCEKTAVGIPTKEQFSSGPTPEISELWKSAPKLVHDAKQSWSVGNFTACMESCRKAASVDPNYTPAYIQWGQALVSLERYPEAEAKYKRALKIEPKSAHAFFSLAKLLHWRGRHEEADLMYSRADEFDPNNMYILSHWAETLKKLGRSKQARAKREMARKLSPRPLPLRWMH